MSEDMLIRHCSATLAETKTGSLFSYTCPSREALTKALGPSDETRATATVRSYIHNFPRVCMAFSC